jgi:hypothetical protein
MKIYEFMQTTTEAKHLSPVKANGHVDSFCKRFVYYFNYSSFTIQLFRYMCLQLSSP